MTNLPYLSIDRCPVHGWWAISIMQENAGGVRVTPSKCCGRWDEVKRFVLSAREWRELAEEAAVMAERTMRQEDRSYGTP